MGFISEIFGYILNFFYELLNNYGLAIIIFSVLLRLILIPITIKQQKTMKKSTKLQEKMKELQEKYKNNPEKLNQATIELYKTEKMSPFSGCFTAILQVIIILSVFWLVSQPLTYMKRVNADENSKTIIEEYKTKISEENSGKKSNYIEIEIISRIENDYNEIIEKLKDENLENKEELELKKDQYEKLKINMEFLGLDLSKVPTESLNDWRVYIIPVLYVLTSFISIKITTKKQNKNKNKDIVIKDGEKEGQNEMLDSMGQMNNSMLYMTPILSISIAVIAPLGLALYWLVSNILIILERIIINKFIGSKEEEENE
ncbi:MAG: YidC/Oxa1 family membrane protein insertase [Clostridiaceae bacterium]|nr:YidC/Oxa1 family membrane protein insertase [Clostridiaceae bacterium]